MIKISSKARLFRHLPSPLP